MASAANGPLGARPLQRVVSDHLGFFAGLRAEGANWDQIAALMASEGLRTRTGGAVSAGVLRTLFSRATAEAPSKAGHFAPNPPASGTDLTTPHIAAAIAATGPGPADGSLLDTIARAARLRGISTNGRDIE